MDIITGSFQQLLMFLVEATGSLGYAIIVFTFLVRSALLPITIPSLRSTKKMQKLQPELKKLTKKHGKDRQSLQKAQMELYKKYNVNPLSGCIPQLAQLGVLILLYTTLRSILINSDDSLINEIIVKGVSYTTNFLSLNLSANPSQMTDVNLYVKYSLSVLAVVTQLLLSLMIAPGAETKDIVPNKSKLKKIQKENKKEEDTADMARSMQQQMMFIMPLMTGFITLGVPSGLALYWVVTTLFSVGQQWYISGPGGLFTYANRAKVFINLKLNK